MSIIVKQLFILLFFLFVPIGSLFSQNSNFKIEFIAEPLIKNAQIVELSTLIKAGGNSSTSLIPIQETNFTEYEADGLCINNDFTSSREELLMESHLGNDVLFVLLPVQTVSVFYVDRRGSDFAALPNDRIMQLHYIHRF